MEFLKLYKNLKCLFTDSGTTDTFCWNQFLQCLVETGSPSLLHGRCSCLLSNIRTLKSVCSLSSSTSAESCTAHVRPVLALESLRVGSVFFWMLGFCHHKVFRFISHNPCSNKLFSGRTAFRKACGQWDSHYCMPEALKPQLRGVLCWATCPVLVLRLEAVLVPMYFPDNALHVCSLCKLGSWLPWICPILVCTQGLWVSNHRPVRNKLACSIWKPLFFFSLSECRQLHF